MKILEKIISKKREELLTAKEITSVSSLEQLAAFSRDTVSLVDRFKKGEVPGVIAEFKRGSPSTGLVREELSAVGTVLGYEKGGAFAASVLTDQGFFWGSLNDLSEVREATSLPLLRKDFMIDPYQIYEAKAHGADLILLIAAALTTEKMRELGGVAHELGLEVLCEVHSKEELDTVTFDAIDLIGVNNRNLKDFSVSIKTSLELAKSLPSDKIWVSESGLSSKDEVLKLWESGYQGFLIGGSFMKEGDPGTNCSNFIQGIQEGLR